MEESSRRLQVDCIDLIQLHSLENSGPETAINEMLPAFHKLKEQGKVRAIGVSARVASLMVPYVQEGLFDTIQPFGTYTLIDHTANDVLFPCTYTRQNNIGVILASPLWMGMLVDNPASFIDQNEMMFKRAEVRRAKLAFLRNSIALGSMIEAAMRFCISCSDVSVTLTGATKVSEQQQNFSFCDGNGLDLEYQELKVNYIVVTIIEISRVNYL